MSEKKRYEEKMSHGTADLPVSIHKMNYPSGLDAYFYLHWHKEFELLIVRNGNIEFTIENRVYSMKKNDIVFINSNLLHSAKSVDGCGASFFAVDFSYQIMNEDIQSAFANKYINPVLEDKVSFAEYIQYDAKKPGSSWEKRLKKIIVDLYNLPEHNLKPYELTLRSHIMEIWNVMFSSAEIKSKLNKQQTRSLERIKPVIDYMQDNYGCEITLQELADIIPMSQGQFCRVFKAITKLSPIQYLNRYRVLQSCRMLNESDMRVGEIANMSGFTNISYFNKVFLKTIGCTPNEYRNSNSY